MHIIHVELLASGWAVRSDQIDNDLVFKSGAAAEQSALALADRLALAGAPCEIRIRLRDGALAGRFVRPATERSRAVEAPKEFSSAFA